MPYPVNRQYSNGRRAYNKAMKTIACCYGTRPEFIKIAPVVLALRNLYPDIKPVLICSGQHRELLKGIGEDFGLKPDIELDIRKSIGNTDNLSELTSSLLSAFSHIFTKIKPGAVMIQGDAASAAFAAIAAFHQELPVFYVEAGLRTYDLAQPFPEEGYRQMISRIANFMFCPTETDKKNLLNEGIPGNKIYVVGNTVVDALEIIKKGLTLPKKEQALIDKKIIVTIHRRENWGVPLKRILSALKKIRDKNPDYKFIVSVHPNPIVKNTVERYLKGESGFELIAPPTYRKFISMMGRSLGVITDSGGIQEEAPSLKIPCLVVREKTERTAGLESGWSMLAGTDEKGIVSGFKWLKDWKITKGGNPYGDGKSALRIAKIIYEQI